MDTVVDVLGIGYGPANLATSVAIADRNASSGKHLSAAFIESHPSFLWHPGMMIEGSRMQISFLKDLATMRDPSSRYTFLSYLHEHDRLASFINCSTTTPTRREFSDYLSWAARKVADSGNGVAVHYGETVESVEPVMGDDGIELVSVTSRRIEDDQLVTRRARNLVVSSGGSAHLPEELKSLQRSGSADILHTSEYLVKLEDLLATLHASATASPAGPAKSPHLPAHLRPPTPPSSSASSDADMLESLPSTSPTRSRAKGARVAIIGGGQSAAEVFLNVRTHLPAQAQVDLVIRRGALRPSDDTGFSNETFDPAQTDLVYALGSNVEPEQVNSGRVGLGGGAMAPVDAGGEVRAEGARDRILAESKATNYSVVNPVTLQAVYEAMYDQRVEDDLAEGRRSPGPEPSPGARLRILPYRELLSASRPSSSPHSGITLSLRHTLHNETTTDHYDAVICATGYERQAGRRMVNAGLAKLFPDQDLSTCEVRRNYRLNLPAAGPEGREVKVGVWLQGSCEASHGISDSLLSVAAVRAGEIVDAIAVEGKLK